MIWSKIRDFARFETSRYAVRSILSALVEEVLTINGRDPGEVIGRDVSRVAIPSRFPDRNSGGRFRSRATGAGLDAGSDPLGPVAGRERLAR
jgi:hypothetical protein